MLSSLRKKPSFFPPQGETKIHVDVYLMWTYPGNIKIAHRYMTVEMKPKAAEFPEKEYINGIFAAVR